MLVCAAAAVSSVGFALLVHVKGAVLYPELLAPPIIAVIVTVFVGADANNSMTVSQCWARILERAWAIILLDIGMAFVMQSGLVALQTGDLTNAIFGFLTVLLGGMLIYAEPFAALAGDVQTLTLIPFAVLRSMMLAWVNMSRIFALLAVQIAFYTVYRFAEVKLGIAASFWIDLLVPVFVEAPLAALFAVAYLDTVSEEHRTLA